MIFKNILFFLSQFFENFLNQFEKIYLNSNYYDKKISKINFKDLTYKPSPHLLSSLINYQKKNFTIDDFSPYNIWNETHI